VPDLWQGMKRAAITGAARAAAEAEQTVRRIDLQRQIAGREAAAEAEYAAIGRTVAATVRAGGPTPDGTAARISALRDIEENLQRLRGELADLSHPTR
jgi:hypothetical protein